MTSADSGSGSGGWLIGGRYRVIERIGSGGMAEVFRAHDEVLDRDVAVKVFRQSTVRDTAAGAARQRTELQTLARLTHPNLITLFDGSLGRDPDAGGTAYLVMELIDGATLADAIDRDTVSAAEVRAIGAQIAAALAYVHGENMVHRDVKPANILLGTDATAGTTAVRARLSDFGIVRLLGDGADGQTGTHLTVGTASYLAPEQTRGSSVGPPADVYALGLVLLEALTRRRAFDGPPMAAAMARLQRDPDIPASLPAPWPQLLRAMTQRDPARRPTAQQVVDVLGRNEAGGAADAAAAAGLLGATGATTVLAADSPAAVPTAATTALSSGPSGPPPGPVRRAAVNETRAMPPVVPPVAPPRRAGANDLPPRRGLPTIVWLAIAAVAVVIIGLIIVLLAGNGGGGGGAPTSTPTGNGSSARSSSAGSTGNSGAPSQGTSSSHKQRHKHSTSHSSSAPSSPSTPSSPTKPSTSPPTTHTSSGPTSSASKPGARVRGAGPSPAGPHVGPGPGGGPPRTR